VEEKEKPNQIEEEKKLEFEEEFVKPQQIGPSK
jgi:hypothetical protein